LFINFDTTFGRKPLINLGYNLYYMNSASTTICLTCSYFGFDQAGV